MHIEGSTFEGGTQVMDGHEWVGCEFRGCTIAFAGLAPCTITGCRFANHYFELTDHALMTMNQLHAIYHGLPGGREFVEAVFDAIRQK